MRIYHLIIFTLITMLMGCATTKVTTTATAADGTVTTKTVVDVSQSSLAVATHNDLLAAAQYATAHGYPARAAVWLAEDAKLTAIEAHISACANSIAADLQQNTSPSNTGSGGPFLAVEMATEAVGNFTGASAKTKITCAAMPVVVMPILPKP